jgi:hypothetical protein
VPISSAAPPFQVGFADGCKAISPCLNSAIMDEFLSARAAVQLAILQLPAEYQAATALSNPTF